jgi:TIR domain
MRHKPRVVVDGRDACLRHRETSEVAFRGDDTRVGVVTEWAESQQVPPAPGSYLSFAGSSGGVPDVADEVRRPAPLFFLSYPNASWRNAQGFQRGPDRRVMKFFDDLSVDVAALVSRPVGSDPGFIDRSSIPPGTRWTDELLRAIGTCKVFIALLSDPYAASEWCGMEWYAFSRRNVTPRSGNHTGIIPVIWTPTPRDRLPPVVDPLQIFSPGELAEEDIDALYQTNGVYGLLRVEQNNAYYEVVVWRLALRIAEFHFSHKADELILRPDELHDIFREDPP